MEGIDVSINRLDGLGIREWIRGPARVVGGEVILDERKLELYLLDDPEENERMAFSLATMPFKSQRPTEAGVREFVKRHGLLWHGRESQGTGEIRESLQDWAVAIQQLWFVGVLYKKITDSVEDKTIADLQSFLRRYEQFFPKSGEDQERYRLYATAKLRDMLNVGLWGSFGNRKTMWGLVMQEEGELTLAYYAPDLLTTAYASFAHLIANKYRFKECVGCRKLFRLYPEIHHSDRAYCEDACYERTRKSKERAKKREQARTRRASTVQQPE